MDDLANFIATKLGIETKWAWFICGAVSMYILRWLFRGRAAPSDNKSTPTRNAKTVSSAKKTFVTQSASPSASVNINARDLELDPQTVSKLRELLKSDQKINAIKLLREQTGLGLAEAKSLMEALERSLS